MDRLEALRAYLRVIELGTLTAAAQAMRVKQSTISKWLTRLEAEFGSQLLHRGGRSVQITDAGRLLYERASQILAAYDETVSTLRAEEGPLRGRLRLSVPVVFGTLHIVPQLPRFMRAHPQLQLELLFDDRYVSLADAQVDVAIRVGHPVDSSLISRRIAVTPRRLVAAPSYLQRIGAPLTPKDLKDHECLLHPGLESWRFDAEGRARRVSVSGRITADNSAALLEFATQGLGVALLASWLVDAAIEAGDLVALLPGFEPTPAPIQALTRPTPHQLPQVKAVVDYLTEVLRDRVRR